MYKMKPRFTLKVALLALPLIGITGCAEQEEPMGFAPACPAVGVVTDGSEQSNWVNGQTAELAHLINTTSMISVNGTCEYRKRWHESDPYMTRVAISPTFLVKGGAAQSDAGVTERNKPVDIPYFVAIIRANKILDKQVFHYSIANPQEGESRVVKAPVKFIDVPTGADPQQSEYRLEVGLQLTPQQLKYNREHPKHIRFTNKASGTKARFSVL